MQYIEPDTWVILQMLQQAPLEDLIGSLDYSFDFGITVNELLFKPQVRLSDALLLVKALTSDADCLCQFNINIKDGKFKFGYTGYRELGSEVAVELEDLPEVITKGCISVWKHYRGMEHPLLFDCNYPYYRLRPLCLQVRHSNDNKQ